MRRYFKAVVFLADAGFTNGAELVIDGGVTRKMVYPADEEGASLGVGAAAPGATSLALALSAPTNNAAATPGPGRTVQVDSFESSVEGAYGFSARTWKLMNCFQTLLSHAIAPLHPGENACKRCQNHGVNIARRGHTSCPHAGRACRAMPSLSARSVPVHHCPSLIALE